MPKPETTPKYRDDCRRACYILDKGWSLVEHKQEGEHLYSINGGRHVPLQTAYEIQIAVDKGDQRGFGTD